MSSDSQSSPAFLALVQASAGAFGGVFATVVLMPLEIVKTRVQLSQSGNESVFTWLAKIAKDEGVLGLFRGVNAKATETGARNFVYFYIYDALNEIVKRRTQITATKKLVLGYTAGAGCTTLTLPLEVLATRVQLVHDQKSASTIQVLLDIVNNEGISALYKGFWFNIALCINPAIVNAIFDRIKEQLLKVKQSKQMTPFEAFVIGAVAKAIATLVTFPFVRLKTMLQAGKEPQSPDKIQTDKTSKAGKEPQTPDKKAAEEIAKMAKPDSSLIKKSTSTPEMLRTMSFNLKQKEAEQGIFQRFIELYRGLGAALFKSVLQAGLLYMTKDQVEGLVVKAFKLSAKMMRRRSGLLKLSATSGRPLPS